MQSESAHDVFSISDSVLSEKLQFVEEIGSGNWGSVWLCRAKPEQEFQDSGKTRRAKLAVKLVHRAKTNPSQTDEEKKVADAASKRVKTLWSEMKIVRTLNEQPHPSIINFQSFIITPSFAMIAMPFLPQLIPVEVPEPRAKDWLKSLLSAIDFCHHRGVVHNDIKPANIMISSKNVPVLIDFGFAERYDASAPEPFVSNLHYGTPEYIAPERAGGLPHDTRKADMWSLGVTLFEILVGRTPFELGESEQFVTTEDLKRYWLRTIQGKWVGSWNISAGAERMLQRMLNPNADLRYTATDALLDPYWSTSDLTPLSPLPLADQVPQPRSRPKHNKAPSVVEILSPWATKSMRGRGKENAQPVTKEKKLANAVSSPRLDLEKRRSAALAPTQVFKAPASMGRAEGKKRAPLGSSTFNNAEQVQQERASAVLKAKRRSGIVAPPAPPTISDVSVNSVNTTFKEDAELAERIVADALASVSPPRSKKGRKASRGDKENARHGVSTSPNRKPLGPRTVGSPSRSPTTEKLQDNYFSSDRTAIKSVATMEPTTAFRVALINGSGIARNADCVSVVQEEDEDTAPLPAVKAVGSAVNRMRDWEQERARMKAALASEASESIKSPIESTMSPIDSPPPTASTTMHDTIPAGVVTARSSTFASTLGSTASHSLSSRSGTISPRSVLGKRPVGEDDTIINPLPSPTGLPRTANNSALNLLKQSLKVSLNFAEQTFGQVAKRSTPALSILNFSKQSNSPESWADEVLRAAEGHGIPQAPVVVMETGVNDEQRMAEWARDVQRVVDNSRQTFEQFAVMNTQSVPTLPPPPVSRRPSQATTPSLSRSGSRMPRKMLAANQIFNEDASPNASFDTSCYGADSSTNAGDLSMFTPVVKTKPLNDPFSTSLIAATSSPARPRRNTINTESPAKAAGTGRFLQSVEDSPSKRKERSRSSANLLDQHISPVAQLNLALDNREPFPPSQPIELSDNAAVTPAKPAEPKRLSTMIDSSVFIASPRARSAEILRTPPALRTPGITISHDTSDELTSSPFHVEPYPSRVRDPNAAPLPDTPSRIQAETVYDRFLMSTSGVKRVGQGYQSVSAQQASLGYLHPDQPRAARRASKIFNTKKPMPAPVSSEDVRRAVSVDELGSISRAGLGPPTSQPEESNGTVWRALKAATTRRISRVF